MVTKNLKKQNSPFTLGIDIGGTRIKMLIIDTQGKAITQEIRELTPEPGTVKAICKCISSMIASLNMKFDRVSAGFPGVVENGIIKTAPNLDPSWIGINFQKKLTRIAGHPARIANDAAVQGYGAVSGKGVELVITLGTGVGSALFLDGKLVPNVQLGHILFRDQYTYEQLLGKAALKKYGLKKWRANLKKAIPLWKQMFNYHKLFLGGGYAKKIAFKLPAQVKIAKNIEGILGGIKLWEPL